ncbi:hypothetical protein [Streptomyces luteireticuli]|uniref:hypothetical protein n=1 Tax=Streptomyces luteireticuli TaxID=173858 RepID=UPI003557A778
MTRRTTTRAKKALAVFAIVGAATALGALPAAADNHTGSVQSAARVVPASSGDVIDTATSADDHHVGSMEL